MVAIIVDGISASGKSLMLQGLQNFVSETCLNFSKLYMTEHLTERFFENEAPALTSVHNHIAVILRIVREIQSLQSRSPFSDNPKILTITIERLFLTLMSRNLMSLDFFSENQDLIGDVKLKSLLLVVPNEMIRERIGQSMRHRNQAWTDYIEKLGGLSGATIYFQQQQESMLQANFKLSTYIPTEVLVIDDVKMLVDRNLMEKILWSNI